MNKTKLTYSALAILFGVFMVIYGGYDDSPGGQLIGVVLVALGVWGVLRLKRRAKGKTGQPEN